MAVRDVREYYWTLLAQQEEMQNDLEDFTEALQNGYITEDKLEEVKAEVARLKENVDRVAYCLFLLEAPNKPKKKPGYEKRNKDLVDEFDKRNASQRIVIAENKSILDHIRAELKRLKAEK